MSKCSGEVGTQASRHCSRLGESRTERLPSGWAVNLVGMLPHRAVGTSQSASCVPDGEGRGRLRSSSDPSELHGPLRLRTNQLLTCRSPPVGGGCSRHQAAMRCGLDSRPEAGVKRVTPSLPPAHFVSVGKTHRSNFGDIRDLR